MSISSLVATHGLIRKGQKGTHVLELQRALAAAGHGLLPDAVFGPITDLAVRQFQTSVHLLSDGIVGKDTARALDSVASKPPAPPREAALIYCYFMYGLGDASTSAGMDVLARAVMALSPRLVVRPTLSWSQRDQVLALVKARGPKARNMIFGNSMGANAIPMVTNAAPECTFDLAAGYDPTIWWSCPAFQTRNVQDVILYHGMNWLNPIGHARYTEAFPGQVQTVNTWTFHSRIDDDVSLHRDTIDRVRVILARAS